MNNTLRLSFALKNAYRVNTILFSLKQIPLIKNLLPATLYQSKGLKTFANVLSLLWELISTFAGKLLYFLTLVGGIGALYETLPKDAVFLHILGCLTIIGSFSNTFLLNPTRDKYYAMILMRMDARAYTVSNYIYATVKIVIGFLPFTILFGRMNGVSLWLCWLLPFGIVGMKAFFIAITLWKYEKNNEGYNENRLSSGHWIAIGGFLAAAYGLPALGVVIPQLAIVTVFLLGIPLGIIGFCKILTFKEYHAVNKYLLSAMVSRSNTAVQAVKNAVEKNISEDTTIRSRRKGFEYLNELFIKRHRKALWKVTQRITYVCLILLIGLQIVMYAKPEIKTVIHEGVLTSLPYFLFLMYCINRGTSFTQALFMNCDHSLLTYAFYKKPNFILRLFAIRLREIMKINALPALVIGAGLALTLYTSGGTDNPLNYVVLIVSVLCMSLFFSLHYLTMYYLLQPYNAGTELKSGTYRIVSFATYFVCYLVMKSKVPALTFGPLTIGFVILYGIVASVLVYRLAPKTFKIRI